MTCIKTWLLLSAFLSLTYSTGFGFQGISDQALIQDEMTTGNCILVFYDDFFTEHSLAGFGVDYKVRNGVSRLITIDRPTMFILPRNNQIPYIIIPGDTISVYSKRDGEVSQPSLKHKYSKLRNTELLFFELMTNKLGPCYGVRSYHLGKNIDSYPKAIEFALQKRNSRLKFLDSLHEKGLIRESFYGIAREYIEEKHTDDLMAYLLDNRIYLTLTGNEILTSSDSILKSLDGRKAGASNLWFSTIRSYVELMDHVLGANGKTVPDILAFFSNLPESEEKDFVLFYYFKSRLEKNALKIYENLGILNKYCKNKLYVDYIMGNTKLLKYNAVSSKVDFIFNLDDESSTIEDIVKKNTGSTIVLDFWASWCQPCLEEMSHSMRISAIYRDSNVVFIMLSTDTYKQPWLSSIRRFNLDSIGKQYIIGDFLKNAFVKKYEIKSIPRYMVFGPDGVLVSSNAPRPSEPDFVKLITEIIRSRQRK